MKSVKTTTGLRVESGPFKNNLHLAKTFDGSKV